MYSEGLVKAVLERIIDISSVTSGVVIDLALAIFLRVRRYVICFHSKGNKPVEVVITSTARKSVKSLRSLIKNLLPIRSMNC